MTCSTDAGELLARPVRMAFIEYEAAQASVESECWWPDGSPERVYWMDVFREKERPPCFTAGGLPIPHQRDVREEGNHSLNSVHSYTNHGVI